MIISKLFTIINIIIFLINVETYRLPLVTIDRETHTSWASQSATIAIFSSVSSVSSISSGKYVDDIKG